MQSALLAQKSFSNLPYVAEKIESKLREVRPDWKQREVQAGALPAPGSTSRAPGNDRLIIRRWENDAQRAKIILSKYDSQEDAIKAIRQLALSKRGERIHGLGDEAYVSGLSGDIVFRTGNLTIYVSAMVNKGIDPRAGINTLQNAARAGYAASAPLARGFAQHIDAVLRTL